MLAVSDLYIRLYEVCQSARAELLRFDGEPACWRRFTGAAGGPVTLKPDARVCIGLKDFELSSFVEVDLGTESLPTIQRKCQVYASYWRSGLEQQTRGVFPRVVWLVPDERRREGIAAALQRLSDESGRTLFSVALLERGPAILTSLPAASHTTAERGGRP